MRMVRPTLAHFFCATLLLAALPAALQGQAQKYEGKQVLTIQFEPKEQPLDASELHDILPLQKDRPLRMTDVRASIERLFATGRYADIQVDAEPYNDGTRDGVIVRFLTKNSWFIGSVTATGRISNPPRAGQLENASALDLGQPFTELKMTEAAAAQQRLMESNGLFRSQIAPSFTYDNNYQQINIRFDVNSGPRARFTTPVFLGDVKLDPQRILRATKFRRWILNTWKPMTQYARQRALGRRARAVPKREPPGSAGLPGIHEVRSGHQHGPAHFRDRRRAAHPGQYHRRQNLEGRRATLCPDLRGARRG